jgi:hypothetical protein
LKGFIKSKAASGFIRRGLFHLIWSGLKPRSAGVSRQLVNVATAQADVIQFAVRQLAKGVAGHAGIIPGSDCSQSVCENGADSAPEQGTTSDRAVGFESSHFTILFKRHNPTAIRRWDAYRSGIRRTQSLRVHCTNASRA